MGCGVACVASILRIPYPQALKRVQKAGVKGDDYWEGFSRRALQTVLKKSGRDYEFHGFGPTKEAERQRRANKLSPGSIVFVHEPTGKYRYGHYLVRTPEGWMDPAACDVIPRLPACPKSYLEPVVP